MLNSNHYAQFTKKLTMHGIDKLMFCYYDNDTFTLKYCMTEINKY